MWKVLDRIVSAKNAMEGNLQKLWHGRVFQSDFRHVSRKKIKVKIQFANYMCGVFIDRFGKDISFRPIDDEHSKLHVDVNVSLQFFGWIFSLGREVKVVGPESVVEQMRENAEMFLDNLRNI